VKRLDLVRFPAGGRAFPFAVILQGDVAERLSSVVVAPICPEGSIPAIDTLTPQIEIEGASCLILLHELAAVQRRNLGPRIGNARHLDWAIKRGLDRLLFEV
jgi:mRNA-degrading endonuclease toxin of MazEF toxin-antitoxin module